VLRAFDYARVGGRCAYDLSKCELHAMSVLILMQINVTSEKAASLHE
jgi:hypothetical protein